MSSYKWNEPMMTPQVLEDRILDFPEKVGWMLSKGFAPHYYQMLFLTDRNPKTKNLTRFRSLVAGRRNGKSLLAVWELLFYCLYPEQFHLDAHGKKEDRPLWCWVLTASYKVGRPSWLAFQEACIQAGVVIGKDVKQNKGGMRFEFPNGSLIEWKSAEDAQTLRGAGLDILLMDEAAFIRSDEAWNVVRPALSDKMGLVLCTTTPNQKNWYWDTFFNDDALKDPDQCRIECRSIDSPYFKKSEWEYTKRNYHPLLFAQEFMASFDSMAGKDLSGEWLQFYTSEDLMDEEGKPRKLRKYIGVDPAISLSANADRFVITVVGVSDSNEVFLLEQYAARIPFSEQLEKIEEYHIKYRPDIIGVESNAYQAALAQQAERLASMPPIVPLFAKGKKFERILAMSPLFRIGKVKIRKDQIDFINEWVDYDASARTPKDDCLDSMEIALRCAGILLNIWSEPVADVSILPDWVVKDRPSGKKEDRYVDEFMGSMW